MQAKTEAREQAQRELHRERVAKNEAAICSAAEANAVRHRLEREAEVNNQLAQANEQERRMLSIQKQQAESEAQHAEQALLSANTKVAALKESVEAAEQDVKANKAALAYAEAQSKAVAARTQEEVAKSTQM